MGCASSSPVVNGEGGGMPNANTTEDMAERAKGATNDAVEAGEKALNDAGEAVTESVDAAKEKVAGAMSGMKMGMGNALTGGMAFMKNAKESVADKIEEVGDDIKATGDDLMKHVPLKDEMGDAVEDLMAEKAKEVDQMADDLIADTEDMVKDVGANIGSNMDKAMSMVGLPKSMDSFKTGPEPELQKLEEMSNGLMDSPKPSSNVLELVDLEATPTPTTMMMESNGAGSAETTTATTVVGDGTANDTTTTTTTTTTILNPVPSLILLNGISTPADTLLLGEVICDEDATGENAEGQSAFHMPPPSPRHDGIVLTEPTQWEQFADSIVKSHLDKSLRRGGAVSSATAAAAVTGAATEENATTEQNIEL